jgi:hypothetical protein
MDSISEAASAMGKVGGRSRSEKKRKSSSQNLAKARAMKRQRVTEPTLTEQKPQ